MSNSSSSVWVLGGGGVSGIAWEVGILTGLADEGVVVASDAVLIGTSAGAVVAAQLTSGAPIHELFERQRAGVPHETAAGLSLPAVLRIAGATSVARSPEHAAQRIGRIALAARVDDPGLLRRIAEARLPTREWPEADVRITVVDAESGELRIITSADGVPLVEAVAASCAVPLASLPVEIGGRHYMDGGMRSTLNLDLAPGEGPVIALAPSTAAVTRWASLSRERAALAPDRRVEILLRDAASRAAQGRAVMDRSIVPALVAAAREQGRAESARVSAALTA